MKEFLNPTELGTLNDIQYHPHLSDKVMTAGPGTYQEMIPMAKKQAGMYLLRVSTATQTQSLKILKR